MPGSKGSAGGSFEAGTLTLSHARLGSHFSEAFPVSRGVYQGSVLSPTLFLIVIDPLLKKLEELNFGLNIRSLHLGSLAHADDLRSFCKNKAALKKQTEIIFRHSYMDENFLTLNAPKCEFLEIHGDSTSDMSGCLELPNLSLPRKDECCCLGFWWNSNLSSTTSVNNNIQKARRAFFSLGSLGLFQGKLNPLSAQDLIETCVMPVLLYGLEAWTITDRILTQLESFQCELGKRALRLLVINNNLGVLLALNWPSMQVRIAAQLHQMPTISLLYIYIGV